MAFKPRQQQTKSGGPKNAKFSAPPAPNKQFKLTGAKPGLGAAPPRRTKPDIQPRKPVGRSAQPDSLYNERVDIANRRGSQRLDDLQSQEQQVKRDFGIDDPTSPFSRMEGLKRSFLQRYRGQSAGLAAQGHLYSGQHERALARTRREEEEARANLRSQYEQAIGSIGAARAGVKFDTEEQRAQAFEDWLARAPESEAPDQGVFAPGPSGASMSEDPFFVVQQGGNPSSMKVNPSIASPVFKAPPGFAKRGRGGGGKKISNKNTPKKVVKKRR